MLRLLSHVAGSADGVTAREVAETFATSRSTAYHLLASLESEGFVQRDRRGGRYRLVATAQGAPAPLPAAAALAPALEEALHAGMRVAFERTGRRTCIGVFTTDGVRLIGETGRQGLPRMRNVDRPTIRRSAHALAIGKLALAGMGEEELRRHEAESGLRRFTAATVTDPLALRRELSRVRRRGFATNHGEYDAAFSCVAAPVRGSDGCPVAAIGVTVTSAQFAAERETLATNLLQVTRTLDVLGR